MTTLPKFLQLATTCVHCGWSRLTVESTARMYRIEDPICCGAVPGDPVLHPDPVSESVDREPHRAATTRLSWHRSLLGDGIEIEAWSWPQNPPSKPRAGVVFYEHGVELTARQIDCRSDNEARDEFERAVEAHYQNELCTCTCAQRCEVCACVLASALEVDHAR